MTARQTLATYGRRGNTVAVVSLIRRGDRVTVVLWREAGVRKEKTIDGANQKDAIATRMPSPDRKLRLA
jgi:hypothetical protein